VMEFDQQGTFIRGWGGESGPGYQWPSNEHGLTVDYKGFVWLLGNVMGPGGDNTRNLPNDNQVLKFTKEGKFVMAIGESGQKGSNKTEVLNGATSIFVYPKTNEVFVSDGYGNSRVMVYDADTGKFKRMWGAYGNKPLDKEDRPPRSAANLNPFLALAEVLQQYDTVHDVKVSNDGLVYICDRTHKRVQVFTLDGKFIKEQFFGLDNAFYLSGGRGMAFSSDPEQKFLYVGGAPVVWITNRKTLEILGSFKTGEIGEGAAFNHPPGHQIGSDNKGNVYVVQAELTGADGKSGGAGAYKYDLKGFSPTTKCCQGVVGAHGTGSQ
jgi:DNA-binding beta-propeller fold protein YncE